MLILFTLNYIVLQTLQHMKAGESKMQSLRCVSIRMFKILEEIIFNIVYKHVIETVCKISDLHVHSSEILGFKLKDKKRN